MYGDKKDVIVVRLVDGTKILISKYAKKKKLSFSETIRRFIDTGLGRINENRSQARTV